MNKPSYYGILPADVRYDKRLKPMARIMYTEITCLSNKTGECTAGNKYFADLYEVTTDTISKWISQLLDCGYITRTIIYKKGSKQVEKRILKINDTPLLKKQGGYQEKNSHPPKKKVEDNITSNNNTSIIIGEETSQELSLEVKEISKKQIGVLAKLCKNTKITTLGAANGWYSNKTQRKALDQMVTEFGFAELYKKFSQLPKHNKGSKFKITTPNQVQKNWYSIGNTKSNEKKIYAAE